MLKKYALQRRIFKSCAVRRKLAIEALLGALEAIPRIKKTKP